MTAKYTKKWPGSAGWYWIKYRSKRGTVVCPARVIILGETRVVHSARNDMFTLDPYVPSIGQPLWFGPQIREP